jgi:hypothetical protein
MTRRRTQRNGDGSARALGLALVLSLLAFQQAWAATFSECQRTSSGCTIEKAVELVSNCSHRQKEVLDKKATSERSDACSCGHHRHSHVEHAPAHQFSALFAPATAAPSDSESADDTGLEMPGSQQEDRAPCGFSCCQIHPRSETLAGTFPTPEPAAETSGAPAQIVNTFEPTPCGVYVFTRPRSRPVYLLVSAFLI